MISINYPQAAKSTVTFSTKTDFDTFHKELFERIWQQIKAFPLR